MTVIVQTEHQRSTAVAAFVRHSRTMLPVAFDHSAASAPDIAETACNVQAAPGRLQCCFC